MKNTTNLYPTGIILTFFTFLSCVVSAQSSTQLEKADQLFKEAKLKEAQDLYLQYASQLSPEQQSNLGLLYIYADPAKKDYTTALQWFQKAADRNSTKAMTYIGALYMEGQGVQKDTVTSYAWYKKAAQQKDPDAMLALGAMNQLGRNTKANDSEAIYWYKMAGENKRPLGYYYAGNICFDKKLYNTAIDLYKMGAEEKEINATFKLGQLYEEGSGVTKDLDEAATWYKKVNKISGYTKTHAAAKEKLYAIGGAVPASDINTMKPILTRLATGAANNFKGLLGDEIPSDYETKRSFTIVSEIEYYKSLLATGLKDVYISKEVVKDIEAGGYRTRAGTYYSFSADIVFNVNQEKADEVYTEWVSLLKAVFPNFNVSSSTETGKSHYFTGYINGKEIVISLYNCCPARNNYDKMVSMTIKQR